MQEDQGKTWSNGQKLFFRFLFIYFILYILPFPFSIPFAGGGVDDLYTQLLSGPVAWTGKHILGIEQAITIMPNGSGDTTFNYVQVFLFFIIALAGALVWTIFARKQPHHERLQAWFGVLLRYYLGVVMLGYGFAKIIPTQFPFPFTEKLMQPVGDLSPMGLLWTFMGYSAAYNFYAGMGEVVGGLLLFFRRTTLLGALILSVVLINVVMLNFCYDVPVKLYSLHLLFICLLLLAPHASRLWKVIVLHASVEATKPISLIQGDRKRIVWLIIKILLIGFLVVSQVRSGLTYRQQIADMRVTANSAVYDVDTFVLRGDTIPPILNNNVRWKRLLMNRKGWTTIEYMDGVVMNQVFSYNDTLRTIEIGSGYTYTFKYSYLDSTRILWKGLMGTDSLTVVVKKKKQDFLLVNRGFHWINEYPFNR